MNYFSRPAVDYEKPPIERVVERVCSHYDLPISQVYVHKRNREIIEARSLIMYLLHKHWGISSTKVGAIFKQDHTTVLHACKKVSGFMDVDKNYKELVNKFK